MKEKIEGILVESGWVPRRYAQPLAQEIADAVGELPYAVGECERCGFIVAWDKVEEAQIAKHLYWEYEESPYNTEGFEYYLDNRREDA